VAFEADEIDTTTHSGWSVVVVGHASRIRDIDRLVALAGPDSQPWAPGRTDHVIQIKAERITGRRIIPGKQAPTRTVTRPTTVGSDKKTRALRRHGNKSGPAGLLIR